MARWRHHAIQGEKNTNWEGGYRVPAMVRWPGLVPPRTEINDDLLRRGLGDHAGRGGRRARHQGQAAAWATMPRARTSRFTSTVTTSATFSPARAPTSAANSSTGPTTATLPAFATSNGRRYSWNRRPMGFSVWAQPMVQLRLPSLFNLRSDPFERAQHEAGDYVRWFVEHAFVLVPAQALVGQHLMSFQQFPPRQRPGSFSVEQAMEKLRNPPSSN